ncbi:uncharacterized protein LOC123562541 [Mercenaria mercenaria]|uniref:uncharacterized protein LOC123562541 n=1 Tax=Mercenaria mercenaria TaxID=6596 RepID=UPI00234FA0E6|nr:uncharacterized protein LOC123562541 [Mercenaria mercenaria]
MENEKKKFLVKKLTKVIEEADKNGVSRSDVRNILINPTVDKVKKTDSKTKENTGIENTEYTKEHEEKEKRDERKLSPLKSKYVMYAFMYVFGIISTLITIFIHGFIVDALAEKCFMDQNVYAAEISRPLVQCNMCRNLDSIPVESGISAEEFKRKYAYTSVPVLIKDATNTWSAMTQFNFQFFKDLYFRTEDALRTVDEECQFFPYNTDFLTLSDVFNMSDARANFVDGEMPWYIGWSNCHKEVRNKLRKHYQRPYFLPNNSESSTLDWIFMGGSGPGALVHLDYVVRPSWQAQISGMKTWTLVPSPECEAECKSFNVTVHKGDIFVVDTNVWYHSTFIHPGDISITIGSEYD